MEKEKEKKKRCTISKKIHACDIGILEFILEGDSLMLYVESQFVTQAQNGWDVSPMSLIQ